MLSHVREPLASVPWPSLTESLRRLHPGLLFTQALLSALTLVVVRLLFGFLESSVSRSGRDVLAAVEPFVMVAMVWAIFRATREHVRNVSVARSASALRFFWNDAAQQAAIVARATVVAITIGGVSSLLSFLLPGAPQTGPGGPAAPTWVYPLRDLVGLFVGFWLGLRVTRELALLDRIGGHRS